MKKTYVRPRRKVRYHNPQSFRSQSFLRDSQCDDCFNSDTDADETRSLPLVPMLESLEQEAANNVSDITEHYTKLSWEFVKIKTVSYVFIIPKPKTNQRQDEKGKRAFPLKHAFIPLLSQAS